MKVYEILLQYSTDDGVNVDSFIFDTYEKAVTKFKDIIKKEKTKIYWIKDAFKSKKSLKEYDFATNFNPNFKYENDNDEQNIYWDIANPDNWHQYDYLELKIMEVQ